MNLKIPSQFRLPPAARKRVLFFFLVFTVAAGVRYLTFSFLQARLDDPGWFQSGTYAHFEERAVAILDGTGPVFWIDDPSRTDAVFFPPGYPLWIAGVYVISGERSAYAVQNVQAVLDLPLSFVLITGLAVTAFGWRVGKAASVFVAFSPMIAFFGVSPFVDSPTAWFVIGGLWLLLYALKHGSLRLTLAAGLVFGCACWLRLNPLYLTVFLSITLVVIWRESRKKRAIFATALLIGTLALVSPIIVRNYLVFNELIVGAGIGVNLWEGLGETEFGRSNGFEFGDDKLLERDRVDMQLPADFPLTSIWPNGINRDRARGREAMIFIVQHPFWYGGVMLYRMWGLLKIVGAPAPYQGTAGINVTSRKILPEALQGGPVALVVDALGMVQSVLRYALVPFAGFGLLFAYRDRLMTGLLAAAIVYYLVPGSFVHSEIRFALPLYWLLPIFAGVSIATCGGWFSKYRGRDPKTLSVA